jgi:hypothetical protein
MCGCCPSVTDTEASVCGVVQYGKGVLDPLKLRNFDPSPVFHKGLKTGYCR